MGTARQVALTPEVLDELAEVERQMQLWKIEAVQLGRSLDAFATALRRNASRIHFRGDLIAVGGHRRSPDMASVIVNLARIRNVVCNLKALKSQRKHLLDSTSNARDWKSTLNVSHVSK